MYNSTQEYEVSILVNGRPITEVDYNGRTYLEGRKNSIYELQIRNKTNKRILAIPAVDGLNVLDGEECGVDSPGYVVGAWQTVKIPGWKVDNQEAAKFVFKPQDAYRGRDETYVEAMDKNPANQGIIGFMIFHEKERLTSDWNIIQSSNLPPFDAGPNIGGNGYGPLRSFTSKSGDASFMSQQGNTVCGSMDASQTYSVNVSNVAADADAGKSLGTGYGKATEFNTTDVEFERANTSPDAVFVYYYDSLQNLKRIGVPVERFRPARDQYTESNPFPASPQVTGSGCTPPPKWRSKKGKRY